MGCLKMHFKIEDEFADMGIMERDSIFDFLRTYRYALRERKTKKITNFNDHNRKVGNLIRVFKPTAPIS